MYRIQHQQPIFNFTDFAVSPNFSTYLPQLGFPSSLIAFYLGPNLLWKSWRRHRRHFPRHWPFVRGIHRSPMNSPQKGQWRGALSKRSSKQSRRRRHRAHYDVTMVCSIALWMWSLDGVWCNMCLYILRNIVSFPFSPPSLTCPIAEIHMIMPWRGNAFRITGPLWGSQVAFSHNRQVMRSDTLMFFSLARTSDLRHYDANNETCIINEIKIIIII